jgi:teichuronic acid exporter
MSEVREGSGGYGRVLASGLAWTTGAKLATQVLTWFSVFFAARMLTPSDFGMIEMVGVTSTVSLVLAEFGLGGAVLQMRELEGGPLRQIHSVITGLGVALCLSLMLVAPWIAEFFHQPKLLLLLRVHGIVFVVIALQTMPMALLQRDLDYRRLALSEAFQVLVQAVLTVLTALLGWGYWGLLAAANVSRLVQTVQLVMFKPVGFSWPQKKMIEGPLRFGMQVAGSRVANTLYSQIDIVLIGHFLGERALGLYRLAMNFGTAPAEKVGFFVMRVTGPLFARLQDNPEQMGRYALVINELLALVLLPVTFGLALTAPELVETAVGKQWMDAVPVIRVLSFLAAIRIFSSLQQQVLTSLRETKLLLWISLGNFVVMPVLFYLAVPFGLTAIAGVWVVGALVASIPTLNGMCERLALGRWKYLLSLGPAIVGSIILSFGVEGIRYLLPEWRLAVRLGVLVGTGVIAYGAVMLVGFPQLVRGHWERIQQMRGKS